MQIDMQAIRWFLLFCLSTPAIAQQAPWAQSDTAISSHDRVYTADQTSNTVSVIDPAENKLVGVIKLGDPVPGALSPLYKGQLLVHGLGYSPDNKRLAVVSVGSNSVTLIDTATNKVIGVMYVGRSPHEAFFTPNGRELWVTSLTISARLDDPYLRTSLCIHRLCCQPLQCLGVKVAHLSRLHLSE